LFSARNCRTKCSTRGGRSSGRSRSAGTWDHRQAEEEVLAEAALCDLLLEVLVRGGDRPHVHLDGLLRADPLDLAFLEHPQHLGLGAQAHVAHLVEEDRPLVRELELPDLLLRGPRERPLLVAEELALDELLGDRRTVDLDERLVPPVRVAVDGAGHELLAHPALAGDEHGRARGRGAPHRLPDLLEGAAAAHHAVAVVEDEPQPPVLLGEALLAERVPRGDQDALAVGRLLDEVEGAQLHRLHRRLHRAVAGEDNDGRRAVLLLQLLQDLEPVHLGHLDVEEHEVRRLLLGELEPHRPVRGEEDLVALVLEDHLEGRADGVLVVDDEDPRLHGRLSTSIRVRKPVCCRGRKT
jgi:hypothetical protein